MSLSILLRNPVANAVAVEPGAGAARLLRYSLRLNRLESRCEVLEVAVSAGENRLQFDPSNSVMAHVADGGPSVAAVSIVELARRIDDARPFLMKIDVEGYESALAPILHCIAAPSGSCAVIELHPAGFNGMGDPQRCFELIMGRPKLSVRALGGARLDIVDPAQFTQIEVFWL
jgi:FkbM family methyltransferase